MAEKPGVPGSVGEEEYRRLVTLTDERRYEEALQRLRVLLERDDISPRVRGKAHHLTGWTLIEGLKRPCLEAVLHTEEALRIAAQLRDIAMQGGCLILLGSCRMVCGDYAGAEQAYRDLLSLTERYPGQITHGDLYALIGLGHTCVAQGRDDEALTFYERAIPLAQTPSRRFFCCELLSSQAYVLARLGRSREARELLAKVNEENLAYHEHTRWWKTHHRATRARVEMAAGDWRTARETALAALALAQELNDMAVAAECSSILAIIDHAEGRTGAPQRARRALTYAIRSGRRDMVADIRHRLRAFLDL